MGKIRAAIIGVGNCASSLVQGVSRYREVPEEGKVPGLMHPNFGDYQVGDIEFVAAFDVDVNKVGKDLSEAVFMEPNNTVKIGDVPFMGVSVSRGMTHDGIGKYLNNVVLKAPGSTADIAGILREREVRRGHQLSAGGQRRGHQVVRGAGAVRRLCLR